MPAEIQRILSTIKVLDEKSFDLRARTEQLVQEVCALPPDVTSRTDTSDSRVRELRRQIEANQRALVHFSEEKVQLAQQAAELVDYYSHNLDGDIRMFEDDLQAQELGYDWPMDAPMDPAPAPRPKSKQKAAALLQLPMEPTLLAPLVTAPPKGPSRTGSLRGHV